MSAKIQVYVKKSVTVGAGRTLEIGYGEVRTVQTPVDGLPAERETLRWQLEAEVDAALSIVTGSGGVPPSTLTESIRVEAPRTRAVQPVIAPVPAPSGSTDTISAEQARAYLSQLQDKIAAKAGQASIEPMKVRPDLFLSPEKRRQIEQELAQVGAVWCATVEREAGQ